MREALEEARAYRDTTKDTTEGGPPTDGGPGSGAHNHKKPRNLTKTAKGIAFSPIPNTFLVSVHALSHLRAI